MLTDLPKHVPDSRMGPILDVITMPEEPPLTRIAQGIYVGPLNEAMRYEHVIKEKWPNYYEASFYGVCDFPGQVLCSAPQLVTDERKFVIFHTPFRRSEQSAWGGWRWHKWGPYIGNQKPTTEYLYDEPEIEEVFTYHIYELKDF